MSLARIHFVVHFADGETVVGAALGASASGGQCYSSGPEPDLPLSGAKGRFRAAGIGCEPHVVHSAPPPALGAEPQCYSPGAPPPGLCVCPTGNTGWRDLPDKPIARLSLVNPHGDMITLQGYEEYNFMVESLQALGMASYVSDVYLMGARDGKVTSYRMRLMRRSLSDPLQVGDITARVIERGKECLGAETTGWRKGIEFNGSRV